VCGLRMLAAENSRKRSEARSPAEAISAGTVSGGMLIVTKLDRFGRNARTGTSPKMFFGSEMSKVRNEHQTQGTAEATQDKESRHRYGNLSDSRPSA
jgi:hypothetical protein